MKIRIFSNMCNGVYRIVINTEDWSQGDIELMAQYGEPEINVGGDVSRYGSDSSSSERYGNEWVRVLHGFPYARGFDSRDYDGSYEHAVNEGNMWKDTVVGRIEDSLRVLREKTAPLPTEEVVEF